MEKQSHTSPSVHLSVFFQTRKKSLFLLVWLCEAGGGAQIWVLGASPSWSGGSGNGTKPQGTDLLSPVLRCLPPNPLHPPQSPTPPPPGPRPVGLTLPVPAQRRGRRRHGRLSRSWRPEMCRRHSCGEMEHCHWPAAMWDRSHRPTWWRCTPCRVTLGWWEGGREGCWALWHSCSLWASHSASRNKKRREESALNVWNVTDDLSFGLPARFRNSRLGFLVRGSPQDWKPEMIGHKNKRLDSGLRSGTSIFSYIVWWTTTQVDTRTGCGVIIGKIWSKL